MTLSGATRELRHSARPPTWQELTDVVRHFATQMSADRARGDEPVFFLSYSGHGAANRDGVYYLSLSDGELSQSRLYDDIVDHLPARYHHLFIDACHAEAVVGSRGRFDKQSMAEVVPIDASLLSRALSQHPSVGILLAATVDQEAHEWSRISAGIFTHELLSAMSGAADVNGDGLIEYSEVSAFVAAANRNVADPRASLTVKVSPPLSNHHAPLADLALLDGAAFLQGSLAQLGHFFIELESGERYLDANFSDMRSARVVLPAGVSAFVRTSTHEAEIGKLAVGETISLQALQFSRPMLASRGSIDASYRAALFASGYGAVYYQGFVDSSGADSVRFPDTAIEMTSGAPRKAAAYSVWAVSGASVVTAAVGLGVLLDAKKAFDHTDIEVAARRANARYELGRAVAIAGGATAIALSVLGAVLWPHTSVSGAISADAHGAVVAAGSAF